MRDLNLNRVINVMAAGSILLTATACGGPEKRIARKFCKALYKCERGEFEAEYSSIKDCVSDNERDIGRLIDALEDEAGKRCADAYIAAMLCGAKAYRKSCDYEDIYDDCKDELEDAYDECYY